MSQKEKKLENTMVKDFFGVMKSQLLCAERFESQKAPL